MSFSSSFENRNILMTMIHMIPHVVILKFFFGKFFNLRLYHKHDDTEILMVTDSIYNRQYSAPINQTSKTI